MKTMLGRRCAETPAENCHNGMAIKTTTNILFMSLRIHCLLEHNLGAQASLPALFWGEVTGKSRQDACLQDAPKVRPGCSRSIPLRRIDLVELAQEPGPDQIGAESLGY